MYHMSFMWRMDMDRLAAHLPKRAPRKHNGINMTLIEFLLAVAVVGMVALQCVILIELRAWRMTESRRRQWIAEEHSKSTTAS